MDNLIKFLKAHRIECTPLENGKISVKDEFTIKGVYGFEWIEIDATTAAVKEFLNY